MKGKIKIAGAKIKAKKGGSGINISTLSEVKKYNFIGVGGSLCEF